MARIGEAMDSSFAKARESLSSFASNGTIGETVLDASSHTLWTRIAIDVKGAGTINGLVGTVLTENGFIQISCYAKEKEFPAYLPVFETIVRAAVLSDGLKYRPGAADAGTTAGGNGRGAIVGIVVACIAAGGLFWFFVWNRRKKEE